MTLSENLLNQFQEECSEMIKECSEANVRISKALRFGLDEVQPGQNLTNRQRIRAEAHDIIGVLEMLDELGIIEFPNDREAIDAKKLQIIHHLDYSEMCGALQLDKK